MIKYKLYTQKDTNVCLGAFNSKHEAFMWMIKYIIKHNEQLSPEDENFLTVFDFNLKTIEIQDIKYNFQPFDKVLVRDSEAGRWNIEFFGYIAEDEDFKYKCLYENYMYCIPYNENTSHLLGTTKDWEEQQ